MNFKIIQKSFIDKQMSDYEVLRNQKKLTYSIIDTTKNYPYFIVTTENQCRLFHVKKYLEIHLENYLFEIDKVDDKDTKLAIINNAIFDIKDLILEFNIKKQYCKGVLKRLSITEKNLKNLKMEKKTSNNNITAKQQILLLHYLGLTDLLKTKETTKTAKLFSLIIDKNEQNVRSSLTYFNQVSDYSPKTPNNLKKVKKIFESVGMPEIIERIDKDIEKLEQQNKNK